MEPTYTILGTDGNQYGPVTIDQFRAWAREGRVGGETQVWRSDQPAWTAAAALPELGLAAVPALDPVRSEALPAMDPDLERRMSPAPDGSTGLPAFPW